MTKISKIDEAIMVLRSLGLPKAQQNERSGLTLLALLNVAEDTPWVESEQRMIRIHGILIFVKEKYGKEYAENTRETIRRQTIHQFEQAGIVARNLDNLLRPTNSPNTVYSITDEALKVIRKFGDPGWQLALAKFIKNKGRLIEKYEKRREKPLLSLELPDGTPLSLSPGEHNKLQIKIVKDFHPRFCPNAAVIYIGDTARKLLYRKAKILEDLRIPITKHDKLPDVVFFDAQHNFLFLTEAVTAHGPLSPKRQNELEEVLQHCRAKRIYISAFPNFREFKRHIDNIAWETEVWIADSPDHIVHFNGPKFFTAYGGIVND